MPNENSLNPVRAVVVDATPLISLDCCGQLEFLRSLYTRVIIPEAVQAELRCGGSTGLPFGLIPAHLEWMEVLPLNSPLSSELLSQLDDGEASVIALALEQNIDEVLIDENLGRTVARMNGLKVFGTIAILLRAKRKGILGEIGSCIQTMRSKGVYLSSGLIAGALKEAGEEG